jgi:hypothetical protein
MPAHPLRPPAHFRDRSMRPATGRDKAVPRQEGTPRRSRETGGASARLGSDWSCSPLRSAREDWQSSAAFRPAAGTGSRPWLSTVLPWRRRRACCAPAPSSPAPGPFCLRRARRLALVLAALVIHSVSSLLETEGDVERGGQRYFELRRPLLSLSLLSSARPHRPDEEPHDESWAAATRATGRAPGPSLAQAPVLGAGEHVAANRAPLNSVRRRCCTVARRGRDPGPAALRPLQGRRASHRSPVPRRQRACSAWPEPPRGWWRAQAL